MAERSAKHVLTLSEAEFALVVSALDALFISAEQKDDSETLIDIGSLLQDMGEN